MISLLPLVMTEQLPSSGVSCCLLLHTLRYGSFQGPGVKRIKARSGVTWPHNLSLECNSNCWSLHVLSHPPPARRLKSDFTRFSRARWFNWRNCGCGSTWQRLWFPWSHWFWKTLIFQKIYVFFPSGIKNKSNNPHRTPPLSLLLPSPNPQGQVLIPFSTTRFKNPFKWIQG